MNSTHLPLKIAVSSCLLGHAVRYDGGHRNLDLLQTVDKHVAQFFPICPEFEAGLGVPRPTIQLVGRPGNVKVLEAEDHGKDHTRALHSAFLGRKELIATLDGYIFKARSPSCAVRTAEIHGLNEKHRNQAGVFATLLLTNFPQLPVIEECDLELPEQLELFLSRCRYYSELKS